MQTHLTSVVRGIVSLFQPPSCPVCGRHVAPAPDPCPECDGGLRRLWDQASRDPPPAQVLAALRFEGEARDLIHRMKYGGQVPAARVLAGLMAARLQAEGPDVAGALLVPVPLHPLRLRERGFNQAERLASGIGRLLDAEVDPGILRRTRPAASQTRRNQEDRRRAVDGVFRTARRPPDGRTLVLVDDVWTTGATAEACRESLLAGGAVGPVWVLVAARTHARVPIEPQSGLC